ncbi:hypothetical protein [Acinetobacter bereziniae]|nr:hypothetical protein [Acinetobacter bereziniae]
MTILKGAQNDFIHQSIKPLKKKTIEKRRCFLNIFTTGSNA